MKLQMELLKVHLGCHHHSINIFHHAVAFLLRIRFKSHCYRFSRKNKVSIEQAENGFCNVGRANLSLQSYEKTNMKRVGVGDK